MFKCFLFLYGLDVSKNKFKGETMKKILAITHIGTFHADEIAAIALLETFYADVVFVDRVGHNFTLDELKTYVRVLHPDVDEVFFIDIGRVYDPEEKAFDHHQWSPEDGEFGKSSAGLIYKWLKENDYIKFNNKELNELIRIIDENDIGIKKAPVGSLPWSVTVMDKHPFDDVANNFKFNKVKEYFVDVFNGIKKEEDEKEEVREIIRNSSEISLGDFNIILVEKGADIHLLIKTLLEEFKDKIDTDKVAGVVYTTPDTDAYKFRRLPKEADSYESNWYLEAISELPEGVEFVHKSGFYAKAENYEALVNYLKEHLKRVGE